MEAVRDVVGRIGASQFAESRGVQYQQKGRGFAGVQHQGEDHAVILVRPLRPRDEHRFTWIAALLTPR
jgi:hypothetical protein